MSGLAYLFDIDDTLMDSTTRSRSATASGTSSTRLGVALRYGEDELTRASAYRVYLNHVDSLISKPVSFHCLPESCNVLRSQRYQSGVKRCGGVHYLPLYPARDSPSAALSFLQCVRDSFLKAQPPPFSPRRIPPCL
jgi:hypothetical protein